MVESQKLEILRKLRRVQEIEVRMKQLAESVASEEHIKAAAESL